MRNKRLFRIALWLWVNACRIVLAATMIFSGVVKIIDPHGTEYKIQDYVVAFGMSEPLWQPLALLLSVALALTEFCLGVNLLFGNNRRWTTRAVLLIFIFFTPFTLYLALENPVHDCGCFGDAWQLTNWQTFGKNVVLLLCAAVSYRRFRMHTRIISERSQWLITLYTWLFAFVLAAYSIYTLPPMDFRPYHIGADLQAKMQWDDTDRVPPINDLYITNPATGEDMTDDVIASDGWKFIVVIPRIEQADDGVMDKLAELTDYCNEHAYRMVALTASNDSLIDLWRYVTGAEYDFLVADEIPLKTMVRSNPGVLLLNGSVVENKWASTQIPEGAELIAPLEQLEWIHKQQSAYWERAMIILAWYLIPLCLWTLLDRLITAYRMFKTYRNTHTNKNTSKMRKHIVAGNWKMNKNLQEGVALATELKDMLAAEKPNCEVIIGTPFIHLATVSELLKDSVIAVSAENCADKESGAYTGEVSAAMVKSTGAEYVILGHSERREYYHETPEILKAKVDLALANGLKVIFCIGESLAEREANQQEAVCKAELAGSVFHLTAEQWKNVVIAYEPIWAIGTGKTATAEQAEEIHAYIRSCVAEVYGAEVADETSILYGGSCKASNAPELFGKPNIDGGLIGGASLKADDFMGIIKAW